MIKTLLRRTIDILRWSLLVLTIFPINSAKAADYTVDHATDFYFTFTEPTQFVARTYSQSDPHLWLYNSSNTVVAANDDHFGLDSYINILVQPGTYRLRAGVCCGNPDAWHAPSYQLNTDFEPVAPTTTIPETTTWPETTTSTTTTTTSTTTAPTTVPVTEPQTTTTTSTTTTTTETPTTTTTIVVETTVTSVPQSTSTIGTTVAPTVAPSIPVTNTTNAPPVVIPPPVSSTSTTTTVASTSTSTSIPESTSSSTSTTTTTTVPVDNGPQISEEEIVNLSNEELDNLVKSIEVSALTEESIAAVFSEEVLSELSNDQIVELIDAIVPDELSDEQALTLSEALTNAPDNVKQEFEQQVDVFGGQFDTYIPTGSTVSVGTRRVVVAAAAASFAMPTPTSSRKSR